jgi:glycine cleavage system aminomethyltransferase T
VPQGWAAKNWSPAITAEQIACRSAAALFDLSSSAKENQCRLGLWGPAAPDIIRAASPDDFSDAGFPAGSSKRVKLGGLNPLLIRTSLVGEPGFELWADMKSGPKLWDALWEAGRPHGLLAAGFRALDALQIENGLPELSRLELENPAQIAIGGECVCENGRAVGRVIRAAYAAASGKSLAYAELNDFQRKPGTKLEIELFGERAPAVVVA